MLIKVSGSFDFAPVGNTIGVVINSTIEVMGDRNCVFGEIELYLVESLPVGIVHTDAVDSPVGKGVISRSGGNCPGGDAGVCVKGLVTC